MKIIKENKKSLIVLSILIILTLVAFIFQKSYAFDGASGTSGNCTWTIDTSGKMIIRPTSGTSCTLATADASPWGGHGENITSIEVNPGVKANENSSFLFYDLKNATTMNLANLDTSGVTNMKAMFGFCKSLTNLNISGFNTNNVTDMSFMFQECGSLTSLNLSQFVTNNVIDMSFMFYNCEKITNLNLSSFNTNNVTNMKAMFAICKSLTNLNLNHFVTNNVTDMSFMFQNCHSFTELDLSNFNISNVTDVNTMLAGIGQYKNEGTKLTLNNKFNKNYVVGDIYYFPYSYYAKEENGTLGNRIYTLSEMKTEVTSSSTPTSWVPAYRVDYNKGSGETIIGTTPQIYRIGSKINTNGLIGNKRNYEFKNWNNNAIGTGDITIEKNETSRNSYGDKYAAVGTNNVITLYAQYEEEKDELVFLKEDKDTGKPIKGAVFRLWGTSDNGEDIDETATSGESGKVEFHNIPPGEYRMKEQRTPEGYKANSKVIIVKVGER